MKVPCCSVCQTRYNEEERVPLLLQCGHGFCKECLSKMFSASPDTTLACPRCRHVSLVGNSVHALRKNFAVLALAAEARGSSDVDYTDDEDDEDDEDEDEAAAAAAAARRRGSGRGAGASGAGSGCGPVIEVGAHPELRLVRRIGEARRAGVEMWAATIGAGGGRCRHAVAVKKVAVAAAEDEEGGGVEGGVEWVLGKLEGLRRASMWCRNVCTFHGVARMEGSLCLVMERCYGSVQSEMQRNEGRLTLEQILRFTCAISFFSLLS